MSKIQENMNKANLYFVGVLKREFLKRIWLESFQTIKRFITLFSWLNFNPKWKVTVQNIQKWKCFHLSKDDILSSATQNMITDTCFWKINELTKLVWMLLWILFIFLGTANKQFILSALKETLCHNGIVRMISSSSGGHWKFLYGFHLLPH